jgi:hypothetical protein
MFEVKNQRCPVVLDAHVRRGDEEHFPLSLTTTPLV